MEWASHTQAQYYLVNITGPDDVIFDDLVFVGNKTSLEIHYNTLVTKKAKRPEKIEVCPVVSAFGNGKVIARTTRTCLSKFNKHYKQEFFSSANCANLPLKMISPDANSLCFQRVFKVLSNHSNEIQSRTLDLGHTAQAPVRLSSIVVL